MALIVGIINHRRESDSIEGFRKLIRRERGFLICPEIMSPKQDGLTVLLLGMCQKGSTQLKDD